MRYHVMTSVISWFVCEMANRRGKLIEYTNIWSVHEMGTCTNGADLE